MLSALSWRQAPQELLKVQSLAMQTDGTGAQNPSDPPAVAAPPAGEAKKPEGEQPSLVTPPAQEAKKLPLPPKSFLIAVATVILTIIVAVLIAIYLGKATQRGPKSETSLPQTILPSPALTPAEMTSDEASPEAEEASPAGRFDQLLAPPAGQEATPSGPRPMFNEATASP